MSFWYSKRVLITGHTGFKGSWLTLWLKKLGAEVIGYSLAPPSTPSLYVATNAQEGTETYNADIRDTDQLKLVVERHQPEIVFHLAAQPLVRKSYFDPIETYDVNVMGTVKLLQTLRKSKSTRVIVNVTSDKCYENKEWEFSYRETDRMGGHDPYSSSKGCAEIVTDSFRRSFFKENDIHLASVRAGNVIGGGDWAEDRLVPDLIRGCQKGKPPVIRNPFAIRPWQHVLEPLSGYLKLAETMWHRGESFSEAWNFGPNRDLIVNVGEIANRILTLWGEDLEWTFEQTNSTLHEASLLMLDCTKAERKLDWKPRLNLEETLQWTVEAYKNFYAGDNMRQVVNNQINAYEHKGIMKIEGTTLSSL
jgi:CDP-glucose 4,6-dehydratase